MEAHILQLDENIRQTDTVKGLQEGQAEIKSIIEEEKVLNKIAFDKGASMFDDLYKKVENMEKQISDGFRDLGTKITDSEISRLEKSLQKSQNEIKTNDARTWDTTKIVITVILSIVATVLLTKFGM